SGGWGNTYLYGSEITAINNPAGVFDALPIGHYTYYVKDTAGVISEISLDMTEPAPLSASVGKISDATCNGSQDGEIHLQISGGNSKYEVSGDQTSWVPGTELGGLSKGTYTIFIRDSLHCSAEVSAVVSEPSQVTVTDTTVTHTQCQVREGKIEIKVNGGFPGYQYSWSDSEGKAYTGSDQIDSLYSGQYIVRITDAHGCPREFTFYVSDVTDLEIDTVVTHPVACWQGSDGRAQVSVKKGFPPYTITWPGDKKGSEVAGLPAGDYLVKIIDSEGCKVFRNFSIPTPDSIWLNTDRLSAPLCYGVPDGMLRVSAGGGTPGYEYLWNTGRSRNTISNLDTGRYTVEVTDKNGCRKQFSYTLPYQEKIEGSIPTRLTICKDNTYPLVPGSYFRYTWQKTVKSFRPIASFGLILQAGMQWNWRTTGDA
ncbi:MAG: hypothetical protein HC905_14110, partial [Bacteroidales bacterium]|nr:hypothetical protein [Bacteroidales bacterium]